VPPCRDNSSRVDECGVIIPASSLPRDQPTVIAGKDVMPAEEARMTAWLSVLVNKVDENDT
jgi:hypothetical protein